MLLQADNLTKTFRGPAGPVHALSNVSLTLAPTQITLVTGPSGSGKTTLLLTLGGLLRPTSGTVSIENQNLYNLSPSARAKLRAKTIGYVFQQFHLIPYLTVRQNILAPTLATPLPNAQSRATEVLDLLQLTDRADHRPDTLSTGERQRTAIARALLTRPKLLLIDEPTGNLDATNANIVLSTLQQYSATGAAILLVSHDPRAQDLTPIRLVLERGMLRQVVESSSR